MKRDDTAAITANICGVSDNLVRKVMRGERENELVVSVYMELVEGKRELINRVSRIAATNN